MKRETPVQGIRGEDVEKEDEEEEGERAETKQKALPRS